MAIYPWAKKTVEEKEEFTLPDELVKQIKDGADASVKVSKIETMLADLSTIVQNDAKERKETKEAAERVRVQQTKAETDESLEEQIEALMLEGKTKQAIALATSGQANAIKSVHAEQVKRDLFEDADKFKYYHGDIKREIDALLAGQPVDFRTNPLNIENCYHTIVGKHTPEIVEGKLKTRFAASEGSRGTSSGSVGDSGSRGTKTKPPITDEVRRAAKQFGIDPEKYADMLIEDGVSYA